MMKAHLTSDNPAIIPYLAKGYWLCQCPRLCRPEHEICLNCHATRPSVAFQVPRRLPDAPTPERPTAPTRRPRQPTKTENEAYRLFCPATARFEPLTFHLRNGKRYTPDWAWWSPDGRLTCLEVKGSYRLPSHGRSQMAYAQAVLDFPSVSWEWVELRSDRTWRHEKGHPDTCPDAPTTAAPLAVR